MIDNAKELQQEFLHITIDSNNIDKTIKHSVTEDIYNFTKKSSTFSFVLPVCSKHCDNALQSSFSRKSDEKKKKKEKQHNDTRIFH